MNTDIISKIKALLAKTTDAGCTEAEAQAAVAMANNLITKHNLSLEDIKGTEKSSDDDIWGEGKVIESGKWTLDIGLASKVVEDYFFVQSIIFKKPLKGSGRGFKLCFYGKKENVITAKYIFDGLLFAFDNLWNKYRRSTGCEAKYRRIFIERLAHGFSDKLKIDRYNMVNQMDHEKGVVSGSTALAIRSVQEHTIEKFKRTYPSLKDSSVKFSEIAYDHNVANAGYNAGRKLNINRSVGHEAKSRSIE